MATTPKAQAKQVLDAAEAHNPLPPSEPVNPKPETPNPEQPSAPPVVVRFVKHLGSQEPITLKDGSAFSFRSRSEFKTSDAALIEKLRDEATQKKYSISEQ